MDQVNADGQGVVYALDMLFGQPANVFCQPLLIKGSYLLHQNDGGPLKAALCVDKVVGGQFGLYPHLAGNGRPGCACPGQPFQGVRTHPENRW